MQRGLVTIMNDSSTVDQQPIMTEYCPNFDENDDPMFTMICPASTFSDIHVINCDA